MPDPSFAATSPEPVGADVESPANKADIEATSGKADIESTSGESEATFSALQAERALLAGLMLDEEDWHEIVEQLAEDDFSSNAHRTLYRALRDMLVRGDIPDPLSLGNELEKRGELQDAGGQEAIGRLSEDFAGSFNAPAYADIVRDRSMLRQIRRNARRLAKLADAPQGLATDELLDEAQSTFFGLAQKRSTRGEQLISQGDAVAAAHQLLEDQRSGRQSAIKSGYTDLDRVIQGFQQGDLVILAARPSVGKTAFALELTRAAVRQDKRVLMFSLEMSEVSIGQRLLVMESWVDSSKLRTGRMTAKEKERVEKARQELANDRFVLDSTPGLRMSVLASRARRAIHQYPDIGLIVVDYLQLIRGSNDESRVQEVSSISRDLKALARELRVPLVALSQLSRAVEREGGAAGARQPRMSDLRDSGTIEQDADLVIFLHRKHLDTDDADGPMEKSLLKVIVEKHRNGPTGFCELRFLREYVSFRNLGSDDMSRGGP